MSSTNSKIMRALMPMTRAEAVLLVGRMLGSYPSVNLHDPEIYVANITRLLLIYPLWAGEKAIDYVKRASKFVPTEADLYPALEDQVRVHRKAAEWEAGARANAMARSRQLTGPVVEKETYAQLQARYGENWGITNPDRVKRAAAFRDLNGLRVEFGDAAIDAVPNTTDYRWQKLHAPGATSPIVHAEHPEEEIA